MDLFLIDIDWFQQSTKTIRREANGQYSLPEQSGKDNIAVNALKLTRIPWE